MKICMLAYSFYDADNRVRRYAEALVRRGDEVDAIAVGHEGQPAFEVIQGVRVFRLQSRVRDEKGPLSYLLKLLLFFFRSAWFLFRKQFRARYDLIHVHNLPDFEVFATLGPRLRGARVLLDMHEITPEFYASKFQIGERSLLFRLLALMEKVAIAYVDHVIVVNHMVQEAVLQRRSVRPEKCTVILNYPDTRIFHRAASRMRTSEEFVICYPGTLSRHQGVDVAVEAVALLREQAPGLRFLIIGDGPERENLRRLIAERNLEDRVTLTGLVPLEQVAEIMARIDLGVVPKRKEGFGDIAFSTKIMEFMAMGVPVLASRTRIDEFYFNDRLVEFFTSGDAAEMAAKILHLMEQPERLAALRRNCSEFIAGNNWNVKQEEYFALVDCVVGEAQPVAV
ncbi:MAG TPA: glycosyltransferase family 4 protein [Terracidiphilus sp.]|jgi:glycosyltransferase involved in cell wall biosynthesis|nr:glycosyltransferase family 4 protein [Terracidiphilus sp.]